MRYEEFWCVFGVEFRDGVFDGDAAAEYAGSLLPGW